MLKVQSKMIKKCNEDVQIPLDDTEMQIFQLIREAIQTMPTHPVARVAGGWVRDKVLGKKSKDIDITIEGMTGIEFANTLKEFATARYGHNQKIIGQIKDTEARPEQIKNLAVAFLRIYGQDIEILNLRGNEVYEPGNRNPVSLNMKATPEEDAFRRDLTINSMFYNINTQKVEDFTGKGYNDLLTMTLRTPLDPVKTFEDDPLRVLRILRFHSRYANSNISPEVIQAMMNDNVQYQLTRRIQETADSGGIVPERTAEELRKIMMGAQPEAAIRIMYQTGLLLKLLNLPQSFHPLHMDQNNPHHELNVIEHIIRVIHNVSRLADEYKISPQEKMYLNFAALFHDIGKLDPRSHKSKPDGSTGYSGSGAEDSISHEESSAQVWDTFSNALKLSDKEKLTIKDIVAGHMEPHQHFKNNQLSVNHSTLRRFMRKNPLWRLQYLHAMADAASKSEEANIESMNPYRNTMEFMQSPDFIPPPASTAKPLVDGNRIMQLVGADPKSGYITKVKQMIENLQDHNPQLTPQEAEEFILDMKDRGEFVGLPPLRRTV